MNCFDTTDIHKKKLKLNIIFCLQHNKKAVLKICMWKEIFKISIKM